MDRLAELDAHAEMTVEQQRIQVDPQLDRIEESIASLSRLVGWTVLAIAVLLGLLFARQ